MSTSYQASEKQSDSIETDASQCHQRDDEHEGVGLRISIALATCQGERFLQTQLDSLARQTRLPYELVIGDDASTDDTLAIIDRFSKAAPFPVRLHINPVRLGFRENFMQAVLRCQGDLIAFCDQDDIWYPHKLARCVVPFSDPEVALVCHDANVVDSAGRSIEGAIVVRENGAWEPSKRPLNSQYALTMVFRRDLADHHDLWLQTIDENAPEQSHHAAHDPWFYFLATQLGKVVNIDEKLLDYRQHGANQIGAISNTIARSRNFRTKYYQLRIRAVEIRMELMGELKQRATQKYRAEIDRQLPVYRWHLEIYKARATIYGQTMLVRRLAAVARTLVIGGYRRSAFGIRAMAADILFGLLNLQPGPRTANLYRVFRRCLTNFI